MSTEKNIEIYLNTIIKEGWRSNKGNLKFQLDTLFGGIDFKGKRVLDIGSGFGLYSFYLACKGAKEVVCLEPEADGSSLKIIERFHKLEKVLKCNNVSLERVRFQDFEPVCEPFDIVFLFNSVNHLDETACINLRKDDGSRAIYQEIFAKINSLSNVGAKLIICDCSPYNFFALFNIYNPFAPQIEWHKHQSPTVWAKMLGNEGFSNPVIQWTTFNSLRNLGRILIGNKLMAYFLMSHFCLTMDKP